MLGVVDPCLLGLFYGYVAAPRWDGLHWLMKIPGPAARLERKGKEETPCRSVAPAAEPTAEPRYIAAIWNATMVVVAFG